MKILSIDCGIKNLALCVLTIDKAEGLIKKFKIHQWENINMFPIDARLNDLKCVEDKCTKDIKFHKNYKIGFCTKHKKKSILENIKEIKEPVVKLINYYDIALAIQRNLDKLTIENIDKIFIEQQPQKNNRMKNFQMMLFQYLVMRFSKFNVSIHFVSPKCKLRGPDCGAFYKASNKKNKYNQNKEVSVLQTHKILSDSPENAEWYKFICGIKAKQDDYCDCFLQAYMYYDLIK